MSDQDPTRSFAAPRAHGSLSSWDDYPVHQTAETIRHAATSDRNFYDRYTFENYLRVLGLSSSDSIFGGQTRAILAGFFTRAGGALPALPCARVTGPG